MATPGGNGGPTQSPSAQPGQAQLKVVGQYIKDLSFKNPNAPRSLAPTETQPAINIQINVIVQQLAETDYEVALKLEGKAERAGSVLFAFELTFAGVFRQRAGGDTATARHDRVPASAVPVRARDRRQRGAQRRLPPAPARSRRFRRALSAACGKNAGGAAHSSHYSDLARAQRGLVLTRGLDPRVHLSRKNLFREEDDCRVKCPAR